MSNLQLSLCLELCVTEIKVVLKVDKFIMHLYENNQNENYIKLNVIILPAKVAHSLQVSRQKTTL